MPTSRLPDLKGRLVSRLVTFFGDDFRRITHALDVLHEAEKLLEESPEAYDPEVVIAAAVLHDVGIKPAEERLGYNDGRTQELYGPPIAREILEALGLADERIDTICNIIGNHHSKSRYPYPELELLKAADGIVNRRGAETEGNRP